MTVLMSMYFVLSDFNYTLALILSGQLELSAGGQAGLEWRGGSAIGRHGVLGS